jgi:CheY-like chemotaxis protein
MDNLRIMVVEDEAIIGMLIEDVLNDMGCRTIDVFQTVTQALDYLRQTTPHYAILDINLRGEQSYPVARELTAKNIPFVFLSGYGAQGVAKEYASAATLPKPFQAEDLEKLLRAQFAD